jgi:ATP-dependent exoDNAse (exonuclease V) beta subunit
MSRLLVLALAALALLAAGCGGDGNGGDETLSTTEWANELCGAITTWTESLQSAAEPLTGGNISREALQEAADDAESSTQEFTEDLEDLGRPDTESGQEAKDLLDGLDEQLDDDLQEIQTAVEDANASNILPTVSKVSASLGEMAEQISATFDELDQLDASNELEQAFEEADSCAEIRSAQR